MNIMAALREQFKDDYELAQILYQFAAKVRDYSNSEYVRLIVMPEVIKDIKGIKSKPRLPLTVRGEKMGKIWQDTVISNQEALDAVDIPCETCGKKPDYLSKECLECIALKHREKQAEISFKAGIREVVNTFLTDIQV